MIDTKKVMKGLECCTECTNDDPFQRCDECPYNDISISVQDCRAVLSAEALELIKEHTIETQVQYNQGFHDGYNQAMSEMPEIVRCKDCKYQSEPELGYTFGTCLIRSGWSPVKDDWYCADGVKKDI